MHTLVPSLQPGQGGAYIRVVGAQFQCLLVVRNSLLAAPGALQQPPALDQELQGTLRIQLERF
jgi:hypothetical protein